MAAINQVQKEKGIFIITGIMASGKSTIAQGLADSFEKGVHLRGDIFRKMIVKGRAEMTPDASEEAVRQLLLRHRLTANTADEYFEAGFNVVLQDNIFGPMLQSMVEMVKNRPLYVIVLCPRPEAVALRETGRQKTAYGIWTPADLDRILREETPRLGLWLDTSELTPEQTLEEILARAWPEARID